MPDFGHGPGSRKIFQLACAAFFRLRYRIESGSSARVASAQPFGREPSTLKNAMGVNRLGGILGTGWMKAALAWQVWRNNQFVRLEKKEGYVLHGSVLLAISSLDRSGCPDPGRS